MIAALMGYAAAVAAVAWAAAAALDQAPALVGRPRRFVWLAALGLSASLAALPVVAAPDAPGEALGGSGDVRGSTPPTSDAGTTSPTLLGRTLADRTREAAVTFSTVFARFDRPLLFLWGVASLAWAGILVGSALRLRRRQRGWSPDVVDGVPVHVSHDVGPAVVGLVRYTIVVPAWMRTLSDDRRRLILEHEMEHARANDPLTLAVGATLVLLQPWNPFVWALFRRLHLAVEGDCDARVLARMPDVRRYGELLLAVGERMVAGAAPVAALSEPHSQLARRISLMTPRTYSRPLARSSAAVATAATLVAAACQLPRPSVVGAGGRTAATAAGSGVGPAASPGTGSTQQPAQRTLVRLTSVGIDGATESTVIHVAVTGSAMVGVGANAPQPLRDTLALNGFPSMTLDVTDGDVSLWTTGGAQLRLEGEVTNGPARRIGGTGPRLTILRGGVGIRTGEQPTGGPPGAGEQGGGAHAYRARARTAAFADR